MVIDYLRLIADWAGLNINFHFSLLLNSSLCGFCVYEFDETNVECLGEGDVDCLWCTTRDVVVVCEDCDPQSDFGDPCFAS
jgi:hypothetical protein